MKNKLMMAALIGLCALTVAASPGWSAIPTQISIQGKLINNGSPLQGSHLLSFSLIDAVTGVTIGAAETGNYDLGTSGIFNHIMDVSNADFSNPVSLEVGVDSGAAYRAFRQPLTTTPYAMMAKNLQVSNGDSSFAQFGPTTHSGWGGKLLVGAGPDQGSLDNTAQILASDGNLHLDSAPSKNIYISYLRQTDTFINPIGGKVGIGKVTPNDVLDVSGGASGTVGAIRWSYWDEPNSYYARAFLTPIGSGTSGASYLGFGVYAYPDFSSATHLSINSNGRVGIGTVVPGCQLDVLAPSGTHDPLANFSSAGSDSNSLKVSNSAGSLSLCVAGASGAFIPGTNAGDASIRCDTSRNLFIGDSGYSRMTLSLTGNVGIGINNPQSRLHLTSPNYDNTAIAPIIISRYWLNSSDTRAVALYNYYNSTTANDQLVFGVSGNGGNLTSPALYANAKMVIQGNGNVGIGTTRPNNQLSVLGKASFGGYATINGAEPIEAQGAGTAGISLYDRTGGGAERWVIYSDRSDINTANTNMLRFWNGNYDRIAITHDGALLIGRADNPYNNSLHAQGSIRTEGNIVAVGTVTIGNVTGSGADKLYRSRSDGHLTVTEASSIRYKENVSDLPLSKEKVLGLRPVQFNWKGDHKRDVGIIAEEANEKVPDLVQFNEQGLPEGFNYDKLPIYLLGVIKEQQKQLDKQQAEIDELKALVKK
jgi:hypothetical protein